MGQPKGTDGDGLDRSDLERIDAACDRFELPPGARGRRPAIEEELRGIPRRWAAAGLLRDLLVLELAYRRRAGEQPVIDGYRARFPDDSSAVSEAFRVAAEGPRAPPAATWPPRPSTPTGTCCSASWRSRWTSSPATTWSPP